MSFLVYFIATCALYTSVKSTLLFDPQKSQFFFLVASHTSTIWNKNLPVFHCVPKTGLYIFVIASLCVKCTVPVPVQYSIVQCTCTYMYMYVLYVVCHFYMFQNSCACTHATPCQKPWKLCVLWQACSDYVYLQCSHTVQHWYRPRIKLSETEYEMYQYTLYAAQSNPSKA